MNNNYDYYYCDKLQDITISLIKNYFLHFYEVNLTGSKLFK